MKVNLALWARSLIGAVCLLPLGFSSAQAADRIVPFVYPTIQEGVDAAAEGDRVLVFDGTYTGPGNHDIDLGTRNIVIESRSGNPAVCIIDCQKAGRAFLITGGQTESTRISGFTIKNGQASSGDNGGAIRVRSSQLTLSNCVFTANSAGFGGAVYTDSSGGVQLTACDFSANSAQAFGGAIMVDHTSLRVVGCTFSKNTASIAAGGAIYGTAPTGLDIKNSSFTQNSSNNAGAIGIIGAKTGIDPTITNCIFSANQAAINGGALGCIFTEGDTPIFVVQNSTFSENTAGQAGGAVENGDNLTIINCIFRRDSAPTSPELHQTSNTSASIEAVSCDIEGGLPAGVIDGGGNIDKDPLFVRVPRTNGPDDPGDLSLRPDSPCVDMGNTALLPPDADDLDGDGNVSEPLPLDLANNARLVGGTVDMGAFEVPGTPGTDIRLSITLTRDNTTGEIIATVTLRNRGQVIASGVQVTEARLENASAGTALPTQPQALDAATVGVQTFRFPSAPSGQRAALKLTGQYQGGTFGGTFRVTLP